MLDDYFKLIRRYPRYLAFSSLHIFFSSPGQSFSFALFAPPFAEAFGLGPQGFGTLYMIATLVGAALLPICGPIIDRVNLRVYSFGVGMVMIAAMLGMSAASTIPVLLVSMLFLRFSGQSLMMQIGDVSTTRFFGDRRGKALAIVGLGLSLGIALFPRTLAELIDKFGWNKTLVLEALFVMAIFLPMSLLLLRKTDNFQQPQVPSGKGTSEGGDWTRKNVLKASFFYFAAPTAILIPFFSTGLIIHLASLAQYKGWDMKWVTACFIVSAVSSRIGSFVTGQLVDRFSARKLFRFVLWPYAVALTTLATTTHPYAVIAWFLFSGFSAGCVVVTMSSLWAETFGVKSLGAIASMVGSAGVFSTSLSPFIFGWLIDEGVSFDLLLLAGVLLTAVVSALAFLAPAPRAIGYADDVSAA